MADLRETIITNDAFSQWQNKVKDCIDERTLNRSTDILVNNTLHGFSIQIHPKYKYASPYANYRGEYNMSSSYSINDVVRVIPGRTYTYPLTNVHNFTMPLGGSIGDLPIILGDYTYNGKILHSVGVYDSAPMPGVWICCQNIPSFDFFYRLQILNVWPTAICNAITARDNDVTDVPLVNNNWSRLRFLDVNYCPIWPELPNVAVLTPSPTTYKLAYGRYWELISLLPTESSMCDEFGNQQTYYVDSTQSGSNVYLH